MPKVNKQDKTLEWIARCPLRVWRGGAGRGLAPEGLSQREIAARLKVSEDLVIRWEHGKSIPTIPMIAKVATLMRTNATMLLTKWAQWISEKPGD